MEKLKKPTFTSQLVVLPHVVISLGALVARSAADVLFADALTRLLVARIQHGQGAGQVALAT